MRVKNDRAVIITAERPEGGAPGIASLPAELSNAKQTAAIVEKLDAGLTYVDGWVGNIIRDYQPERRVPEYDNMLAYMNPVFRAAQRDLLAEARQYRENELRMDEPASIKPETPAFEAGFLARLEPMTLDQRLAAMQGASYAHTSAVVRYGDAERLFGPEAQMVRREHRIQGLIERSGIQASYGKAASLNDPIPVGIDNAAVRAAAERGLAEFNARGERVKLAATMLQGVVDYLSAATNRMPQAVWLELMS